jgi:hypothetical protein
MTPLGLWRWIVRQRYVAEMSLEDEAKQRINIRRSEQNQAAEHARSEHERIRDEVVEFGALARAHGIRQVLLENPSGVRVWIILPYTPAIPGTVAPYGGGKPGRPPIDGAAVAEDGTCYGLQFGPRSGVRAFFDYRVVHELLVVAAAKIIEGTYRA